MHEWSLASGIVETVEDECRKRSVDSVATIRLSVGELAQIEVDTLREALRQLKKGTVMEGCRILIKEEKTSFSCRKCGHRWSFSESRDGLEPLEGGDNAVHYLPSSINAFAACPSCGSRDFDIVSGFGLSIESFKPGRRVKG